MTSVRSNRQHFAPGLNDPASASHRLALFAILLAGFFLRYFFLREGHAFNVDTIRDQTLALKYALDLLAGDPKTWYLAQPALNHGQLPGPLWTLLVAALYKLGGNSANGALYGMMVINSVAILPFYMFATRLMSPRAALFSTCLFALSPWPIYYSAGLYNPMALPLPSIFLYWSLWHTLTQERSKAIFWVMLFTAMIAQFHMISIFYYPAILLLLWLSPTRLNRRALVAGILAGTALYLPYLVGDMLHHFANLRAVLTGDKHRFNPGAFKYLTAVPEMLSNHPGGWPGDHMADLKHFGNRYFGSYWILLAINLISFGLALKFVYGLVRRFFASLRQSRFHFSITLREHRLTAYLGTLLILPLLLYTFLGKDYASRYSIIIFPLLFLLPALSLSHMKSAHARQVITSTLVVMLAVNVYLVMAFAHDQQRKFSQGPYYMPAFYKLSRLYHAVRDNAGSGTRIVLDTTALRKSSVRDEAIAAQAITNYFSSYDISRSSTTRLRETKKYVLTPGTSPVPAGHHIVFRDVGLVVYSS